MDYHNWEKGKKLLYHGDSRHEGMPRVVTFDAWTAFIDRYDVIFVEELEGYILPSDVMTKEQIDAMFEE